MPGEYGDGVLIEERAATDAELTALVTTQQRELREADGGLDGQVTVVHDDASYLVAVVDQRAVACGAVQRLEYVGNPYSVCFEKRLPVLA
jgi:putative acetyltransferase